MQSIFCDCYLHCCIYPNRGAVIFLGMRTDRSCWLFGWIKPNSSARSLYGNPILRYISLLYEPRNSSSREDRWKIGGCGNAARKQIVRYVGLEGGGGTVKRRGSTGWGIEKENLLWRWPHHLWRNPKFWRARIFLQFLVQPINLSINPGYIPLLLFVPKASRSGVRTAGHPRERLLLIPTPSSDPRRWYR